MRLIFEPHDDCYYFEVILTPCEVTLLKYPPGLVQEFTWDTPEVQDINVCVRTQEETRLCHSLKEKQPNPEKDSPKTSEEKWKPENHKNKPLRLLIRKREGEKGRLPKKKGNSRRETD